MFLCGFVIIVLWIEMVGICDFVLNGCKFLGNVVWYKCDFFLYYGMFLYDFDFDLILRLFKYFVCELGYCLRCEYKDFLINFEVDWEFFVNVMIVVWNVIIWESVILLECMENLVCIWYGCMEWIYWYWLRGWLDYFLLFF